MADHIFHQAFPCRRALLCALEMLGCRTEKKAWPQMGTLCPPCPVSLYAAGIGRISHSKSCPVGSLLDRETGEGEQEKELLVVWLAFPGL